MNMAPDDLISYPTIQVYTLCIDSEIFLCSSYIIVN